MYYIAGNKQDRLRRKLRARHLQEQAAWRLHVAQVRRQVAAEPPSIVNALVLAAS